MAYQWMGKLSYNDKLRMQTLWQVSWFTQNGWTHCSRLDCRLY